MRVEDSDGYLLMVGMSEIDLSRLIIIMSKSIELRGSQRLDITVCLEVLNTRLSLIAVILSGGSGGVVLIYASSINMPLILKN